MSPEFSRRVQFARRMASHPGAYRLYGILDEETCCKRNLDFWTVATAWKAAGIRLIQYRDKLSARSAVEERAHALRALFPVGEETCLILNDDPAMADRCNFDGVHVGQTDAAVKRARELVGPDRLVGVSTHSPEQAIEAQRTDCDYVAAGPVFTTTSKADAEPCIGLCGVQAVRAVISKPLVAIGGIGLDRARQAIDAGADAVAVISGLLPTSFPVREMAPGGWLQGELIRHAQDFLRLLK